MHTAPARLRELTKAYTVFGDVFTVAKCKHSVQRASSCLNTDLVYHESSFLYTCDTLCSNIMDWAKLNLLYIYNYAPYQRSNLLMRQVTVKTLEVTRALLCSTITFLVTIIPCSITWFPYPPPQGVSIFLVKNPIIITSAIRQ